MQESSIETIEITANLEANQGKKRLVSIQKEHDLTIKKANTDHTHALKKIENKFKIEVKALEKLLAKKQVAIDKIKDKLKKQGKEQAAIKKSAQELEKKVYPADQKIQQAQTALKIFDLKKNHTLSTQQSARDKIVLDELLDKFNHTKTSKEADIN